MFYKTPYKNNNQLSIWCISPGGQGSTACRDLTAASLPGLTSYLKGEVQGKEDQRLHHTGIPLQKTGCAHVWPQWYSHCMGTANQCHAIFCHLLYTLNGTHSR